MTRANLPALVMVFLLLPFIQIGGNSFFSVGFVSIFFLAACCLSVAGVARALRFFPILFFAFALPYFDGVDGDRLISMVARSARELVVLVFLLAIYSKCRGFLGLNAALRDWLPRLLAALVGLATLQFFAIAFGFANLVFLPWELFGSIAGDADAERRVTTVASYWLEHAAEHELSVGDEVKVRPSAFYAEPSYLGFVLFSLYVAYSKLGVSAKSKMKFFLFACAGMLVSKTLSGLLILVVYYAVSNFGVLSKNPKAVLFSALAIILFLLLGEGERLLMMAGSGEELSGYIRLVQPLINIYTLIENGLIFGIHPLMAPDYFNVSKAGFEQLGFDNAFFNLFQFHGLGAFLIIAVVVRVFPRLDVFYLLLVCFFNGTILGFDKGFVVGCILLLSAGGDLRAGEKGVHMRFGPA